MHTKFSEFQKSRDISFRDQGCELLLALDTSEQQAFFDGVVLNDWDKSQVVLICRGRAVYSMLFYLYILVKMTSSVWIF